VEAKDTNRPIARTVSENWWLSGHIDMYVIVTGQITAECTARPWAYFAARGRHFSVISQRAVNISVGAITSPCRPANIASEIQRWDLAGERMLPGRRRPTPALGIHKEYPAAGCMTGVWREINILVDGSFTRWCKQSTRWCRPALMYLHLLISVRKQQTPL